ncbi:MAG: pilus assembly protein TadG-related protein [Pseudomonadota bacterium]|nr:pilus assembly protein TadG-related protein [Pseudomonadota bacterium]
MLKHRTLESFWGDRKGGLAIIAAIAAPVLLMLAGGAVDVQRAEAARVQLQDALDAAVLSGAGADSDGDTTAAESAFAANNPIAGVTPAFELASGVLTGEADASVATSFLKIIGVDAIPIAADAIAIIGSTPCVLLLEPAAARALETGAGSTLDARSCPIQVNSTAAGAAYANNGSVIRTESLCVKGTAVDSNATISPQAVTGCAPVNDPFASTPEPVITTACQDRSASGAGAVVRLPAGGCWRNVTSSSGGTIIFEPGVHRITGLVKADSRGTVQGLGTTLFFTGDGALEGASRSTITLSAPTAGPTAGMALWQSRTGNPNSSFLMNADVTGEIEGVVYIPRSTLALNSDVTATASYTLVIANKMLLSSRSTLVVNANYANGPPLPRALRPIRLES